VPVPTVTIDPPSIDLANLQVIGQTIQVDMTLTNHGLIAAKNVSLGFGDHPFYKIEPLVGSTGLLSAKSSLTVPVKITRIADFDGTNADVPCQISAGMVYSYEVIRQGAQTSNLPPILIERSVPIPILNVEGNCLPPIIGNTVIDFPNFYGNGGSTGGGGGSYTVPIDISPVIEGVQARVKISIDQEAVTTRSAFLGSLEIDNGNETSLENLLVALEIRDQNGVIVNNNLFGITQPILRGITAVDGTGILTGNNPTTPIDEGIGSARWTFIPTNLAALEVPTKYTIGGQLSYTENGARITVPLIAAPITVFPQAELYLDYFQQRNVYGDDPFTSNIETAVPFSLGVLVRNEGKGDAKNLRITSSQPKIIENQQGLLVDFEIIGSQVNGTGVSPSLAVNFGDIAAGGTAIADWQLKSSIQGKFSDYKATFEHVNNLGIKELSLIKEVKVHELIHQVQADRAIGDDNLPDFLVNDVADANFRPETLYFSNGGTAPVAFAVGTADALIVPSDKVAEITASTTPGWSYIELVDPAAGQYQIKSVVRSDGKVIKADNVWLTDRTFPETGRPTYENILHLLDFDSTGSYTITYTNGDAVSPTADIIDVSPDPRTTAAGAIDVLFSEAIQGSTFDYQDLSLTLNGGANLITSEIAVTLVGDNTYRITGLDTSNDGQYELSLATSGITDLEGNAGTTIATETWTKATDAPAILAINGIANSLRNSAVNSLEVAFSQDINASTLSFDDLSLTLNGGTNLIGANTTITAVSGNTYQIGNIEGLTGNPGNYVFSINATGVQSLAGNAGIGNRSVNWQLDNVQPTVQNINGVNIANRRQPIQQVEVTFSESIDIATLTTSDIILTRDGVAAPLSNLNITNSGNGKYLIEGLAAAQTADGNYQLIVNGGGISDIAGNVGNGSAAASWSIDTVAPIGIFVNQASESPTGISSIDIEFSESINASSLTLADLNLTRDGVAIDLSAATIAAIDDTDNYRLSGLTTLTTAPGSYVLSLDSAGVFDLAGNTGTSSIVTNFTVTPSLNTAPIKNSGDPTILANTNEDTDIVINSIDLLAGFSDVDGNTLSVANLSATNGTLVNNNNGTFTFTPEANFNGEVTLVYDVTDGIEALTEQTLSFNVLAVNDSPTGSPTVVISDTTEDEAFVISASDLLTGFSDVDENTLSVINLVASNGILENIGNEIFTFTPDANFNGMVTLTYDVSDGTTFVANQTRSFNVVAVNDAPTGSPTSTLGTSEDTPFTINASELLAGFSDVDADILSVVNLVANNGTLIYNENGSYGFTPDADFNGEVVLTYEVSDGTETLIEQTLSLNVTAVNDIPTGSPTGILADGTEDSAYTITASDLLAGFSDVDGNTLAVANLAASNGTVIDNSDGTYTFSPNANFNGLVSLTYDVSDGTGAITGQTLSFNLTAVNDAPTGSPTATLLGATEDNDFTIDASDLLVGFNDVDGDILSVVNLITSTGTLVGNEDGNYTFTPNANFNGEVVLTYGVTDGIETLTEQSISFNVAAVNDAPTGSPTGVLIDGVEDTVVVINTSNLLAGFSDIDGDTLAVANLAANNGTLANNNNGTYSFTPDLNFNGEVTLTYDVTDGTAAVTAQTLIFSVTAVNDAPTGSPTATLPEAIEDTAFTISTTDLLEGFSDVDGDVLSIANLVASNGTLTNNGNETYTFSPNANFNGAATLTYDVTDGLETLASQTLNFSVAAVNDAPIGSPTAILPAVAEDTVVTINVANLLAGFSDIEGDTLSITNLLTSNGTLTDNGGGIFSLTPEANFNGEVTLTYDVSDGLDSLTAQSLSFNITPVNDAPTGSPTATLSNTAEDSAIVINASDLLIGFSDVDGDTLSVINLVANNGVLVNNSNGTYNFTPIANFNGIIDLTYDVTDGAITLTGQTQSFGVTPVNDAPTLQQLLEDQSAGQNQPFTFTIPGNTFADIDAGDTLALSAALANGNSLPSWLSFNPATRTFSGTPPLVNIGSLNIRVTATDSAGASVSDVFALDIGLNIVGTLRADNLVGSNGFDTISGLNGNDTIDGGRGADRLDGGSGDDRLLGGTGRDTLIGGTGNDTLDGGADDDSYEASGTQAEFDTFSDTGAAGSDTLVNIGSTALTLNGFSPTNGIESINGNNQAIIGNNNANVLNFSGVILNSVLFIGGGTGNDSITGNSANNDLRGNNGDDVIDGGAGDDWLDGGSQNDRLLGAAGDDTIIGGSGNDTLDGGEGNDTYHVVGNQAEFDTFADSGTSGTDTIINLAGTALTLNGFALNNGIDVINGNNQAIIGNNNGNAFNFSAVTFNNVSFVSGGNGDDSIIGTALGDNLQGGAGDDNISGGAGADRLDGGAQNDSLLGGIGDDTLVGGTGNDTLDGGEGSDTYEVAITQAEFDLFTDTGTSGNDTLRNTGNSSLTLNGFSITNGLEFVDGNNRAILGNNNNNNFNFSAVTLDNVLFVDGGSGNDFFVGSTASDNLRGGNGNDTIDGGNGADNLFGGAGNDSFIFNSSNTGIDTINDFTIGGDTLRISSAGFGGTGIVGAAGALAAARFTTGAAATTAAQRFVYNNASGSLFFDIDGNGSATQVQIALLNSRPALNSNSFSIF
jgi:Ca2+-binding RTX toxin-like protein